MDARSISHPTDQTLNSYGLGKLDDASERAVNDHLEHCLDCRKRVAEVSADSFLSRIRNAEVQASSRGPDVSATEGRSMLDGCAAVPASPPADTLPPGLAEHPDYQITRELGRGGMGVVYLVQNTLMGRPEVFKVVSGQLINRPGVLDRFLREIRSAARLRHANIVTAYAALRIGESLVLAMEYVEGLDLARMVQAKGPLPVAHACNFAYQAALGLQHAHEHGMVHRDIKPANLILSREGKKPVVKVLDFGLAKVTIEGQDDRGLTREGQMLGTPDFIAPEQIRDAQSADIRADIYSLGCTLFYLLTGGPPFSGDNLWDLYQAHFSMDAPPLNLVRPEVPVEVAALVAKMMAKDPTKRFQTPGEVAQAMVPYFKSSAAQATGSSAESPRVVSEVSPHQNSSGPKPAKTGADGGPWGTLIAAQADEPLIQAVKPKPAEPKAASAGGPVRRPTWKSWPVAAAAASAFGPIVLGIIITIRTKDGTKRIVVPEDAAVITIEPEQKLERPAVPLPKDGPPKSVVGSNSDAGGLAPSPAPDPPVHVASRPAQPQAKEVVPSQKKVAERVSGSWRVDGDALVMTDAKVSGEIRFGDPSWSKYDLTFKVIGLEGLASYWVSFHRKNSRNQCQFAIGDDRVKNITYFSYLHDGKPSRMLDHRFPIELKREYTVRLKVRGPKVWTYVDGQEIFDDIDVPLTEGRIAFSTERTAARFRDIVVMSPEPEGKILWKGPPDCLTDDDGKVIWQAVTARPRQPGGENKPEAERPAARLSEKPAGLAAVAPGSTVDLLPAGDSGRGAEWAYTTTNPGPRWVEPDFPDGEWKRGSAGFGAKGNGQIAVGTPLEFREIWLRKKFDLPEIDAEDSLILRQGRHDIGCEIFVNGRPLYMKRNSAAYYDTILASAQKKEFTKGPNVIAVKSIRSGHGRPGHLDIGLRLRKAEIAPEKGDGPVHSLFNGTDLTSWKQIQAYCACKVAPSSVPPRR